MTDRLRRPRKSILSRPEVLDPVHFVLGDDGRVLGILAGAGLALDRQVVGQRIAGDHHGGGVDAVLAAQPLEPERDLNDLLGVGVGVAHGAQLGRGGISLLVTVGLGDAGVQRACHAP